MTEVFDFIRAALPWIMIGLVLAFFIASMAMGKTGLRRAIVWPSIGMFVVAVLEYMDHDTNSATTWFVIGFCFIAIALANKKNGGADDGQQD